MTREDACSRRISCSSRMVCCTACSAASPNLAIAASKVGRLQLETDRQGAHRRHDLGLADENDRPRRIGRPVGTDRRQSADGADPAIGEGLFAIDLGRIHVCLAAIVGGTHVRGTLIIRGMFPDITLTVSAGEVDLRHERGPRYRAQHPHRGRPDTIRGLTIPHTVRKVPPWTTLLGVALFGLALVWLHHVLGQYRWQDILAHMRAIPASRLAGRGASDRGGVRLPDAVRRIGSAVRRRASGLSEARPDFLHGLRDRPQRRPEYLERRRDSLPRLFGARPAAPNKSQRSSPSAR